MVIFPGGNSVTKITLYLATYFKIRPLDVQIYPLDVKSFSYFDIFIKTPSQIESKIQLNFKGQLILSYFQQYKQNWCYFQIARSTQMLIHLNQAFRQKRTYNVLFIFLKVGWYWKLLLWFSYLYLPILNDKLPPFDDLVTSYYKTTGCVSRVTDIWKFRHFFSKHAI